MTAFSELPYSDTDDLPFKHQRVADNLRKMFAEADRKRKDRRFKILVWIGLGLFLTWFWWAVARAIDMGF